MFRSGINKITKTGYNLIKTNCKQFSIDKNLKSLTQESIKIEANFNNNVMKLPTSVFRYIEETAKLCTPDRIHLCDGSEEENAALLHILEKAGSIKRLKNNK